jgi:DNA-binding XRE family transcriptional regulator
MSTILGELVYKHRTALGLTQDQLGKKYGVSGPAIFKFEKGFVNPSLKLWMRMAADFDLGEGPAILLWMKAKLPPKHQDLLELKGPARGKGKATDFSRIMDRDKLREAALADAALPSGLKSFVRDDEIWHIYRPGGGELNWLRDYAQSCGDGKKGQWREALRALRAFTGRED